MDQIETWTLPIGNLFQNTSKLTHSKGMASLGAVIDDIQEALELKLFGILHKSLQNCKVSFLGGSEVQVVWWFNCNNSAV